MIRGGKLLLETPDSRKTNAIKGGAGAGGSNNLIPWSEGDLASFAFHVQR